VIELSAGLENQVFETLKHWELNDREQKIVKFVLETAQKEIAIHQDLLANHDELLDRCVKAEAKVEAVNKKLDKEIKEYSNNTMRPAIHDEFIIVLKNIKKSLEIPRSEVPEEVKKLTVGRVPPHVMAKTVNPRKEAQDFCVEEMMNDKENTTP